jgi:hypothetical protein
MPNITMKERIGLTAGAIWSVLSKKNEVNVTQLPKVVKEKTLVIHQALGWLAREGKIDYRSEGEKLFVSLIESEKRERR